MRPTKQARAQERKSEDDPPCAWLGSYSIGCVHSASRPPDAAFGLPESNATRARATNEARARATEEEKLPLCYNFFVCERDKTSETLFRVRNGSARGLPLFYSGRRGKIENQRLREKPARR